jgi:hypothetical protein
VIGAAAAETTVMDTRRRGRETTLLIRCNECRRDWRIASERWRLKVLPGTSRETVPYCPECHAREFGKSHA